MATELREDGRPAYREVIVSVPRQAGKSVLLLVALLAVCLEAPDRRVAYSAQTGGDARRKLLQDFLPLLRRSRRASALVKSVHRAQGAESVTLAGDSRIELVASVADAGHGRILDGAAVDEAWADIDDRREAALVPTMLTRPHARLWIASSAGTEQSVYWARKCELGRALAEAADTESGIAYFEWSAPADADSDDEDVWAASHPAVGLTVDLPAVRHMRKTMSEAEFRRAILNIPTSRAADRVIPLVAWQAVRSEAAAPSGRIRFAADATADRSSAAIVAYGGGAAELVDHRDGVVWLRDRLAELARRHEAPVVLDAQGPLAPLVDDLRLQGVRVLGLRSADVATAALRTLDAIVEGRIRVRAHAALDAAAAAVRKRPLGERWFFARMGESDVSPVVALSLAVGAPDADTPVRLLSLEEDA